VSAVPSGTTFNQASAISNRESQTESTLRPWTALRDWVIQTIWRINDQTKDRHSFIKSSGTTTAPSPRQFGRYAEEVVLRFNISNEEEATKLAEVSSTLFLDIWEFTDDWVDVRLSQKVVGGFRPPTNANAANNCAGAVYAQTPTRIASKKPRAINAGQ